MFEIWGPLAGGLILLVVGGELLVRGAVRVAAGLGVSPLVIGLTLVGFGTSTPELVTSVQAALAGAPGIAYGNIVGSSIANILLIAGIAALVSPMIIASSALKRDGVVMLAVAIVFSAVAFTMPLGRVAGGLFVAALLAYIYLAFRQERAAAPAGHGAVYEKSAALQETDAALVPAQPPQTSLLVSALIAIGGLVLVVMGGRLLVDGAVALARSYAISETVIGLTIVAVGTSMPELVTSVVAGIRKQGDVAFGNIVGSNIYNILGIGGFTALASPGAVPQEIVAFDNLVMIGVSLAFVAFAWTGLRIARWEGAALLCGYVGYVYAIWP
ncbi:calcium/sodium antiporter [Afifella marina]|uniref:Cation:H+ antiporter n=2 Tax=Hyphomicrobiales TaxID=356 RepID=A0A1G5MZJ6_AFIMA|nr:calcium/sodium antiporter [Afifella marina]MBK1622153.1 sodium:calcium antiporter [Afifella marina DSM 2698]MBK1628278.1 sodium:calcium antiporter [Afifella marina]MBK5918937.1 sodium:calcium antiporter [Afifella marina]RAI17795.1 sodium:calcium antiporter [Afifella marina DSM 2698]SCZ29969.1 cation:H+ antiporter [Afifella marina DSM 2698]